MASKSKAKGNSNEYDVRDRLSAWYGKSFNKCPNSGALRWGGVAWVYGDLVPPEDFPACIEAKHYAKVHFDELLGRQRREAGSGLVASWWYDQAVLDAERATSELGRHIEPLLIWKQDRHRHRLCLREKLFSALESSLRKQLVCMWVYIPDKQPFMVVDFELFLQVVSPKALLAAISCV